MKNLKVRTKLILILILVIFTEAFTCIIALQSMMLIKNRAVTTTESTIRENYDQTIKDQVGVVISMLNEINEEYKAGKYTLQEAEELAADEVRQMRYGEAGYFWVDTSEGTNVVLLGSATEGTNRMDTTDADGYQMVKEIIRVAVQEGGGYVDYVFPKEGETESSPKRSYSEYFEPFDWVVGTGNYTDYIDTEVAARDGELSTYVNSTAATILIACIVLLIIITVLIALVVLDITRSLRKVSTSLDVIAGGNFAQPIPEQLHKRRDDFGKLGKELENMRDSVRGLLAKVKDEAANIDAVVENIDKNVYTLNGEIEDVSATTEELAASTEETAASAEQINTMTQQIDGAAREIATRAQDGAAEAEDIHKRAADTKSAAVANRQKMAKMRQEIRGSLEKALEEAKVVEQISVLADSILSITGQTNLLALNASIEAARAGEAGKGFAVVAEEIRVLAEQSKEAVANIQKVTENVNHAVENLAKDSNRMMDFVDNDVVDSFDLFEKMADDYNNDATAVNDLVADFSAASQELVASINSITESIDGITTASNDSAQGTTSIAQKTVSISNGSAEVMENAKQAQQSAEELHKNVENFVIE